MPIGPNPEKALDALKKLLNSSVPLPRGFEAALGRYGEAESSVKALTYALASFPAPARDHYLAQAASLVAQAKTQLAQQRPRTHPADIPALLDRLREDGLAMDARTLLEARLSALERRIALARSANDDLEPEGPLPPLYQAYLGQAYRRRGQGQLILGLHPPPSEWAGTLDDVIAHALSPFGLTGKLIGGLPYAAVACPFDEAFALAERLQRHPAVRTARPAQIYRIPLYFKGRRRDQGWNLDLIQAPQAWGLAQGEGTVVAVVDTGVDYTHSQLKDRFGPAKGYNVIADTDDPMDDNEHGTHCAGIVARKTYGVAPKAQLLAVKVLDELGTGFEGDIARGIQYAADQGADVISMSFGGPSPSALTERVCAEAFARGIVLCAAAGNDGVWRYEYPASYDEVLSVAAVDARAVRAPFSQMNDRLDLSAPGVDILSTIPHEGFASFSGTSMATPHISGVAALLKSYARQDAAVIAQQLVGSGKALGAPEEYGEGGLVQAYDALLSGGRDAA